MPPKRRATSSPGPPPSVAKKSRTQPSNSVSSDDDEEPDQVEESGAGNEDEENEEVDLDLSQVRDFEPANQSEAEVGIIEHVNLKNFMCHSRLEFKFCPQVNFVIGRNGSGKSAVLTSIVIGLGGKANATNRGSSVKSFIKTGKQSAEIMVKLRNRGQDAYKPDVYGQSIVVERRLARDGTGSYKIKSEDGKLVSTKREELNHILDALNIQVDNPVSILNQDCSRNFLHSKNAGDKYKFFLKATQLEQLKNDYVLANESKDIAQDTMENKMGTMPGLEREVQDLENQYKASQAVDGLKEKVKALQCEQAWAVVTRHEKELEGKTKELRTLEARKPKFVEKVDQQDVELNSLLEKKKELDVRIQENMKEATSLDSEHKEAKQTQNKAKKVLRDVGMEQKKHSNELRGLSVDHRQLSEKIDEIKNSAQQNYERERQMRAEKMAELEQKLTERTAVRTSRGQEVDQFRSAINRYKEDEYRMKADEQTCRGEVNNIERQVRQLESSRSNRLRQYGEHMPDILSQIETASRRGQFSQKPRGPLGASLRVREPKWALAVEKCLGDNLICAFAVNNFNDEKVLQQILERKLGKRGKKPTIIVSQFQPKVHDVSRHKAQSDRFPTVLDMLIIEDPVVTNTLIDQRGIESVLLMEDVDDARLVMEQRPPANCSDSYTMEGDHLYSRPTFRYQSNNGARKPNYLTASVEDNIRYLQTQLQEKQTHLQALTRALNDSKKNIQNNQREEQKCMTHMNKLDTEIRKITHELTELRDYEEPAPVDVATLEEEAGKIYDQIKAVENKKVEVDARLATAQEETRTADEAFRDIDARLHALAESVDPYREEQAQLDDKIGNAKAHKRHYSQKLKEHEQKIKDTQKEHDSKNVELEYNTKKSEETFGERVIRRQQRTPENIGLEIAQIKKQIAKQERTQGNHEELTRRFFEKGQALAKIRKELGSLQRFLRKLDQVMENRQSQFFEFRRMIAVRAKTMFIMTLQKRNYTGKILFNHQKETLTMTVTPSSVSGSEGSKDMKSLSGGERSFATVCFILSLWETMESPFRCLDEFDVFMDLVNRRIATEMMLHAASQQGGRQFIFLTPLELSQMKLNSHVRVYRMPDPDRGQGTLPFQPVDNNQEDREEDQ